MIRAAYTGTFDPISLGHADLIGRASELFEHLLVAVAASTSKNTLFTLEQRVDLARESLSHLKNVEVHGFTGLVVNFARDNNVRVLVRGIRNVSDYDYEVQMAQMVRHISPGLDTVILPPSPQYGHISSTLVREIALLGGNIDTLVPAPVAAAVRQRQAQ